MANGTALLALPAGPLARSPPLRVACGRWQGCGIRPDLAPPPRALWRGRCRGLRDAADAPPVPLGCVSRAALPTVGRAVLPPRRAPSWTRERAPPAVGGAPGVFQVVPQAPEADWRCRSLFPSPSSGRFGGSSGRKQKETRGKRLHPPGLCLIRADAGGTGFVRSFAAAQIPGPPEDRSHRPEGGSPGRQDASGEMAKSTARPTTRPTGGEKAHGGGLRPLVGRRPWDRDVRQNLPKAAFRDRVGLPACTRPGPRNETRGGSGPGHAPGRPALHPPSPDLT
ncbi:uncharacterized protein [Equus caballus]|uniref:uncharacterized protein n=1 Tax=Equus caballus TaxID=9796 RepID=UPI0038B3EA03